MLPAAREDHILPFCADQRHPRDTLFIVAEEDWRLKEAHCMPLHEGALAELPADLQQRLGKPQTEEEVRDARANVRFPRDQHLSAPPAGQAAGQPDPNAWEPPPVPFDARGHKPASEEFTATSSHITNLVKIMSESSRAGAGHLLWLSWTPNCKRGTHPNGMSGLLALTAEAARVLVYHFDQWFSEPGDWDVLLREAASTDWRFRMNIEAGYTWPAIGHFREHASPNLEGAVRHGTWHKKHILQDTVACGPVHHAIEICAFTEGGHRCVLHPGIRLPESGDEDFRWWTASISILELPAGNCPSAEAWDNKWRAAGRNPRARGRWVPKNKTEKLPALATSDKDDRDPNFPELKTSTWQIWDEYEVIPSLVTASFLNRWRQAQRMFNMRCFTNNPGKATVS